MRNALLKVLLIPLSILTLCACDDSNDAKAQEAKLEQKFTQKLINDFEGAISGTTTLRPVSLSLKQNGEQVTGTLKIGESTERDYLFLPLNTDIPVEGTFDPLFGYARLVTKSGARTGEIILEIAQSPEGAIGTFSQSGRHGNKGPRKASALFVPVHKAKHLKHVAKTLSDIETQRPTPINGACPKNVSTWIEKAREIRKNAKYTSQNLQALHTPEFAKAFGASYDTIDAQGLKKAYGLLSGACVPESRSDRALVKQLSHMVGGSRIYKDAQYRKAMEPVVNAWWGNITNLVSSDVKLETKQLDSIQTHFQTFQLGQYYINYRKDLDPKVRERRKMAKQEELKLSRLDLMDQRKDRIDLLFLIAQAQLREYPDTKDLVTQKLDEHAMSAAQAYADNAKWEDHLQYMASFSAQAKNGVGCMLSSQSDCKKIGKIFDKRSDALSYDLAKKLTQDAEQKIPAGNDLPALVHHAAFAEKAKFKYRNALEVGGLAKEWKRIAAKRQKLQKNLYKELYTMVDNSKNANAVVQIEKQYFIDDDIKQRSMKKIDAMLSKKLEALAPFRNLLGGEYLNALVSKDARTLQKLDQEYTQGFKPFLAMAGNAMAMINPSARASMSETAKNMTAVNAVFATYMLDYQRTYPNCLGQNPFKATVSTTTTEITKNGSGFEVARSSWTTKDAYTIPRRLAPHFERLWRADFRGGDSALSDALFNDEKIGMLVSGLKQATKKYPCDHPHIKALEKGMISYYARFAR